MLGSTAPKNIPPKKERACLQIPDPNQIVLNLEETSASEKRTRNELQDEAVDLLLTKNRLIVEWGTGVGKSRVAIRCAQELARRGVKRMMLLVTETAHKDNWRREFVESLGNEEGIRLFDMIKVECYASLNKYEWTNWEFVICDEAHHLRSDNRTDLLATIQSKYLLCLSATLSEDGDGQKLITTLNNTFGVFQTVSFGLQEAIDSNILAEPKIYVHSLPLDGITGEFEINISWGFTKYCTERACDYEKAKYYMENRDKYKVILLKVTCNAVQGYELLESMVEWNNNRVKSLTRDYYQALSDNRREDANKILKERTYAENDLKQYGMRRKLFLGACKTKFANWLLANKVKEQKFICFCATVEQGHQLGADTLISSKTSAKTNKSIIDNFNNGVTSSLFAVGMIKEGANLKGIQTGIVIQLGGKERDFIQQFGRAMRSSDPVQHLIVIDETQDVKFFEKSTEGINKKYFKFIQYGSRKKIETTS